MKANTPIGCRFGRTLTLLTLLALTASTARADYQSAVLNDHPVGYWPLSLYDANATNGLATDLSGNGNTGTYVNISTGFNDATGPSAYITNGVSFDGSTTYVDLSMPAVNTALLNFAGPITMEAWVQPANPSAGANMDIIGKGDDVSQSYDEVAMRLDAGGGFNGGTYNQSAGDKGAFGGTQTTNWTYLVTTYDGTNWNLYVNGVLVKTSPDTVGAIDFTDPWRIGDGSVDGSSRLLAGNLSQVVLYTNALKSAQVLTHYLVGLAGTTNVTPVIVQQPASQIVSPSATVTFNYQAQSLLPVTNLWFKNSVPLPNQTNATLVLTGVQTNDSASYSVVIGNSAGTTNSAAATLTVDTQPTTIIWQTPQIISGASDVLTNGAYYGSWAPYNGSANTMPVNGVAFQGFSDLPGLTYAFDGGNGGYNMFGSPNTADTNYNALLEYGVYSGGPGRSTFSWGGMTPGHTYEIEFWVEDVRGYNDRWENLSGGDIGGTVFGTDTSGPLGYSSPVFNNTTNPGYYIVGTFVADNTTSEEILLSPFNVGGSSSAQVNLFQVRDITAVAKPAQPSITGIHLAGTNLIISGINGSTVYQTVLLSSTNVSLPLASWIPVATNTFASATFSITNTVDPHARQNYYTLRVP
jgi:hypothetical protein